jgi:hypothetical protein
VIDVVLTLTLACSIGVNLILLAAYRNQRDRSDMYKRHASDFKSALLRIRCSETMDPHRAVMEHEYEAEKALAIMECDA